MSTLLVVGGGLFGSMAAAYARRRGIEAVVFDPRRHGAASPAAAGLFKEAWAGKRSRDHFHHALPLLDQLYGLRQMRLLREDGEAETFQFVPPSVILEATPRPEAVTSIGDGWVEAGGRRYEGWVYLSAGMWCQEFVPGLRLVGKAGSAFLFSGEREGRIHSLGHARQALAFVRDSGFTYFSDGTAEADFNQEHDRQTLAHAAEMGLKEPVQRLWGRRPYAPGGPFFRKLGDRLWVGTGGRKMGTIVGASFARRLVEEELRV